MRFKKISHAIRALDTYARKLGIRSYLVEGEAITPAEDWLMEKIVQYDFYDFDYDSDYSKPFTKRMRNDLVGIARSLGLFPIPEWFHVKRKLLAKPKCSDSGATFGVDYGRNEVSINASALTVEMILKAKEYLETQSLAPRVYGDPLNPYSVSKHLPQKRLTK